MYDPATQTFHKLFLRSQGASGGTHLALKAIPNKNGSSGSKVVPAPERGPYSLQL